MTCRMNCDRCDKEIHKGDIVTVITKDNLDHHFCSARCASIWLQIVGEG
jgi:ribosomal protein L24E